MEMTRVGTLTLMQIWLTTMILAVVPMDLTVTIDSSDTASNGDDSDSGGGGGSR